MTDKKEYRKYEMLVDFMGWKKGYKFEGRYEDNLVTMGVAKYID